MQNGPGSTKAKQQLAKGPGSTNLSFNQAQKIMAGGPNGAAKVPSMGQLNNKLVPQLYMRGYSPSKPQWKF